MDKWALAAIVVLGCLGLFRTRVMGASQVSPSVKVNQVGYLPHAEKLVIIESVSEYEKFAVIDTENNTVVYEGTLGPLIPDQNSGHMVQHGDFSQVEVPGRYLVKVEGLGISFSFSIGSDVYCQTLIDAVRSYSLQRSNTLIDDPITGLKVHFGHKQDREALMYFSDEYHHREQALDVSGGWYDAGDYGKYIPPAAVTAAQLLLAYELNPQVFTVGQLDFPFEIDESEEHLPDILTEIKFELEWMEKMQRPDGAVYHKVAGRYWPGPIRPEEDTQVRYIYGMSSYGTAQFAAVMAMAARIYEPYLPEFAQRMLDNALSAQEYLTSHKDPFFRIDPGQGDGSGPYDKQTDEEERLWALAELYKTTGNEEYNDKLLGCYESLLTSEPSFITWGNTLALAQWAYFSSPYGDNGIKKAIKQAYVSFAQRELAELDRDGYRNILDSEEYTWASAKNMLAKGNLLLFADYMEPNCLYLEGALDQLHNVLGRSASGFTYVTGAGTKMPQNLHHRLLQSTGVYIPGYVVGGPNRYGGDPDLDKYLAEHNPKPALAYLDVTGSWSSNEYAIDYTAPLVFMLAHFVEKGAHFPKTVYEAEDGVINQLQKEKRVKGYSGDGYVTGFTNDTGTVTFHVDVPREGLYQLTIGYGTPHGQKNVNLAVNHVPLGEITLYPVEGFGEVSGGKILLNKGTNTITLGKGWGWYHIDYISLESAAKPQILPVKTTLSNKNAGAEAENLMKFLVDIYGKYVLSGQQEYVNSNYADVKYIYEKTGKNPAILGLDLIDYSPSRVEHGARSQEIETAIDWHKQGGIVALTWHWNAPTGLGRDGKPWWSGFYTDGTTFDIAAALADPASNEYALLIRDMDAIAAQLQRLADKNIPVLWRPLHEAEGGWFWWGAQGPEPAVKLWRLMFERFTYHHQLDNLIWVWNSVSPQWYPGDDYVDIVSVDLYTSPYDYNPGSDKHEALLELGEELKIAALGENGSIPDPDLMEIYGTYWSWFVTWNGDILRNWTDIQHLRKVYTHSLIVTLEQLPDLMGNK